MDQTKEKVIPRHCPRCNSAMFLISPIKDAGGLHGCNNCGMTVDREGHAAIKDVNELRTLFKSTDLAEKKMEEFFASIKVKPTNEVRALFAKGFLEYGLMMWFDGLQQGLVMNTLDKNYTEGHSDRDDEGKAPEGEECKTD